MTPFVPMISFLAAMLAAAAASDSTTYDWTKQICCGGKVTSLKSSSPVSQLYCCGNSTRTYNPINQLCCGDDNVVLKKDSDYTNCCGSTTYDYRKQICCNDSTAYPKTLTGNSSDDYWTTTTACCGSDRYDTTKQSCCDGSVQDQDCGNSGSVNCYNSNLGNNQICCSEWDSDSQAYEYKVVSTKGVKSPACCGLDSVYSMNSQLCCSQNKDDGSTQYQVKSQPSDDYQCCGLTVYNSSRSACCNNYDDDSGISSYSVVDYPNKVQNYQYQCCGNKLYNTSKQVCCYDSASTIISKKDDFTQCCGGKSYQSTDPDHQCCNNTQIYNSTSQLCCGDYPNVKVVTKNDLFDTKCCGNVTYNDGSKMCCDKSKGPVARPTATTTCCGENYYGRCPRIFYA